MIKAPIWFLWGLFFAIMTFCCRVCQIFPHVVHHSHSSQPKRCNVFSINTPLTHSASLPPSHFHLRKGEIPGNCSDKVATPCSFLSDSTNCLFSSWDVPEDSWTNLKGNQRRTWIFFAHQFGPNPAALCLLWECSSTKVILCRNGIVKLCLSTKNNTAAPLWIMCLPEIGFLEISHLAWKSMKNKRQIDWRNLSTKWPISRLIKWWGSPSLLRFFTIWKWFSRVLLIYRTNQANNPVMT